MTPISFHPLLFWKSQAEQKKICIFTYDDGQDTKLEKKSHCLTSIHIKNQLCSSRWFSYANFLSLSLSHPILCHMGKEFPKLKFCYCRIDNYRPSNLTSLIPKSWEQRRIFQAQTQALHFTAALLIVTSNWQTEN